MDPGWGGGPTAGGAPLLGGPSATTTHSEDTVGSTQGGGVAADEGLIGLCLG